MRTCMVLGLLACSLTARGWEDPWVKADGQEFNRLHAQVVKVGNSAWTAEANRLRRAYNLDVWVESKRAPVEVHAVALIRGDRQEKFGKAIQAIGRKSRPSPPCTLHEPNPWLSRHASIQRRSPSAAIGQSRRARIAMNATSQAPTASASPCRSSGAPGPCRRGSRGSGGPGRHPRGCSERLACRLARRAPRSSAPTSRRT